MDDIVSYNDWLSRMMRNEYAFLWIDESVGTHICFRLLIFGLRLFWSWFKPLLELV